MKLETEIIHKFIKTLLAEFSCQHTHIVRMESNLTEQGIPDLYACIHGINMWIEFKIYPNDLSPLQKSWIAKERNANGVVAVITYDPDKNNFIIEKTENNWDIKKSINEVVDDMIKKEDEDVNR